MNMSLRSSLLNSATGGQRIEQLINDESKRYILIDTTQIS